MNLKILHSRLVFRWILLFGEIKGKIHFNEKLNFSLPNNVTIMY